MVTFGEETVQKTPALHYTGLLDNPFSNLELRNLTLTWKRGEASRWRALLSPKSSERLVRHARARIPNDVRVREGDYFVGSRAPQTQGRKEERKRARKSEISMNLFRWIYFDGVTRN